MCPACIATAAWIAAGTASAGGVTTFAVMKFRKRNGSKKSRPTSSRKSKETSS